MTSDKGHNLTGLCAALLGRVRTEPRNIKHLDTAGCLFLSILPHEEAVPALICLFVALTLTSLAMNGCTLLGIGRSEDLSWQPRFVLLKNLILSDFIQTVTLGPSVIHSLVHQQTMSFNIWCQFQYFCASTCILCSLITITCMALERYTYVCHAIRYLSILTSRRMCLVVSLTWVICITLECTNLVLLHMGGEKDEDPFGRPTSGLLCEPDTVEQHMGFPRASAIYRKLVGSFILLLCLLTYAFSYLRMYQDARNAVVPFNMVNTRARNTVLFYCGMLFLQLLPILLKVVSDALWEVEGTGAMVTESFPHAAATPSPAAVVLHMSLLVMVMVPPCINPLIHGLRNAEVREALPRLFWWRTERRDTELEMAWVRSQFNQVQVGQVGLNSEGEVRGGRIKEGGDGGDRGALEEEVPISPGQGGSQLGLPTP